MGVQASSESSILKNGGAIIFVIYVVSGVINPTLAAIASNASYVFDYTSFTDIGQLKGPIAKLTCNGKIL